ncbi:zinc finger protein 567-like [Anopheles nili]|uniref:zinc finger protein 567-like n=1 Tax=Anopheles nili TaxID=185578 RepID=UPI00237AC19E|nr:zinc finger protein 567-like [Anopheles nili]
MALAQAENISDTEKCDVCLEKRECISITDPVFGDKDVLAIVKQHLDIKIILTYVCKRCWSVLHDFDEFCKMVNLQHHSLHWESELTDRVPDSMFATEFVEIKNEPLAEEVEMTLKEEQEIKLESSPEYGCDKLMSDQSSDEDDMTLAYNSSVPSKSNDKFNLRRAKRTASKDEFKKESKIDADILQFYKRLVCEICDAEQMLSGDPSIEYSNLRDLNKHMRKVHDLAKSTVKCPMCDKKFQSRSKLLEHRAMHLDPDRFRCSVCQEVHQNLTEHMQNKHQERTYCCEECGKKFPFKARLSAHMRKMHTAKDVVCDQCQKCFSKYTIEDHKRAVHESRYICEHCPRTFQTRFSLEQHMEEHVEGMRNATAVACNVCGFVLRNKYSLSSHMKRMHTEHPPVSCVSCGKVFKSQRNLNTHLANVCTDRTFPCPICSKQFKKKIKLKEHMTTHTKSALYQCPYCPKTFSFETQLYTHRKQVHYDQWLEMQRKRKEGVRFKVNRVSDMPSV